MYVYCAIIESAGGEIVSFPPTGLLRDRAGSVHPGSLPHTYLLRDRAECPVPGDQQQGQQLLHQRQQLEVALGVAQQAKDLQEEQERLTREGARRAE